jgi:hypothetical protein
MCQDNKSSSYSLTWVKHLDLMVWGDFPSLYSRFYKVIMLESTNATNDGKTQV